jgi:energy-coupling factor transporter ATP-binding protein EcfA2
MIRLEGVSHTYTNGTVALRDVDLKLNSNDFTVLIGPSGAGKSTLMRVLNGLVKPSNGLVWLNELEVTHANETQVRLEVAIVSDLWLTTSRQFAGNFQPCPCPNIQQPAGSSKTNAIKLETDAGLGFLVARADRVRTVHVLPLVAEAACLQLRTYQRFEALKAERDSFNPALLSVRAVARALGVALEALDGEPSVQELEAVKTAARRGRGRPRKAIGE